MPEPTPPNDRWLSVERLFHGALARDPEYRAGYLRDACGADSALLREVESLLANHGRADALLETPAIAYAGLVPAEWGPDTAVGPFRIVERIGAGGMGEVFRARDTQLGRDVALKVLPPSFAHDPDRLSRFHREAHLLASLNHPGIAAIHGLIESDGRRAIVMEFVPGETLAAALRRGPLLLSRALDVARQLAAALETAHENNVVHRDLKPLNVILDPTGRAKVLDFGLAVPARPAGSPSPDTLPGAVLGTPGYMSPEQAAGLPVDKRADIWAFGVVLWEMLAGRPPAASPLDLAVLPSATPPAVVQLLRRCLDPDPLTRLRDIGEARVAIDAALLPADPVPRNTNRRYWLLAAGGSVATLSLAAFRSRNSPAPIPPSLRVRMAVPPGILTAFSLSPDGRFVLFTTTRFFLRKIWIRALDQIEPRLLTDVAGLGPAFWSPDGKYVGVPAADKLFRIPVGGGEPEIICDSIPPYGINAVWLDNGAIVANSSSGLQVLPPRSSTFQTFSSTPSSSARRLAPVPGGRFLYARGDGTYLADSAGGSPRRLFSSPVDMELVPPRTAGSPAHFLYLRENRLFAQPVDPARFDFLGNPSPVAAQPVGGVAAFASSPNGSLLLRPAFQTKSVLSIFDRNGRKLRSVGDPFVPARNPMPRLSPDGSRFLIAINSNGGSDLWATDLKDGRVSRLSFSGASAGIWTPDGAHILRNSTDSARYLKAADGSGQEKLLFRMPEPQKFLYPYDWTPDGKYLLVTGGDRARAQIWVYSIGSDRKFVPFSPSKAHQYWARLSPDGQWVAYISEETGMFEIYVESFPAGRGRWQLTNGGGSWPVWRRDGKELFFLANNALHAIPIRTSGATFQAGKPQPLFPVPPNTRFDAFPDGQRFILPVPVDPDSRDSSLYLDTSWSTAS